MACPTADLAHRRKPFVVLLSVFALGVLGAGILHARGSTAFEPYFGVLHPVLITTSVLVLGMAALAFLRQRHGLAVFVPSRMREGLVVAALAALVLAAPVILVDLSGGFPGGINVEAPESLLFYPVIALVAENVFHAVPLAVTLLLTQPLESRLGRERTLWLCILLAACIEPTVQVLLAPAESPAWATTYVSVHVLIFNVLALYFFKRYDFATMYLFRTQYYLLWHVLWGFLRLRLLFGVGA